MSWSRKRLWRNALFVCPVLVVLAAGAVYWRATRALHLAHEQLAAEGYVRFTARALEPRTNSGFEWIGAPAVFSAASRFQDKLYVSGSAGLFEYDSRGSLTRQFLVGRELPPSPLGLMARATLADSQEPELLIATDSEGVLAFNGRTFRQIRPDGAETRNISSILPLSSGRLLIGTRKRGVLVYDGREIAALHPSVASLNVTALAGDDSELWIGTLDRGVVRFHAGQADTFGETEGLPDAEVHSIAVVEDGAYVGTSAGVAEFRSGKLQRVLAKGAFARALLPHDKQLLVGTMDEGVAAVPLGRSRIVPVALHGTANVGETRQIFESEGAVYAVANDGLYSLKDGAGWKRVLSREGAALTDHNVSALAVDRDGRLWVGYFDRGLDIVSSGGRTQHVENERAFCINRIVPQRSGDGMYVATANGLLVFDNGGNEQQVLKRSDGLIADHVTDVVPWRSGIVAATPAGLTFADGAETRSLYAFHGLVNNHVYALGVAGDRLMAGTLGGLTALDDEKIVRSFTTANSELKHNWITAVVPLDNDWLIGTYGAGVMRLDPTGHFEPFDIASGNIVINPNAMLATGSHVLAGTLGDGLLVYDRDSHRWTVVRDGLPSANVTALAAGGGFVYIGTDNGLVRIGERNLP